MPFYNYVNLNVLFFETSFTSGTKAKSRSLCLRVIDLKLFLVLLLIYVRPCRNSPTN